MQVYVKPTDTKLIKLESRTYDAMRYLSFQVRYIGRIEVYWQSRRKHGTH